MHWFIEWIFVGSIAGLFFYKINDTAFYCSLGFYVFLKFIGLFEDPNWRDVSEVGPLDIYGLTTQGSFSSTIPGALGRMSDIVKEGGPDLVFGEDYIMCSVCYDNPNFVEEKSLRTVSGIMALTGKARSTLANLQEDAMALEQLGSDFDQIHHIYHYGKFSAGKASFPIRAGLLSHIVAPLVTYTSMPNSVATKMEASHISIEAYWDKHVDYFAPFISLPAMKYPGEEKPIYKKT